MAITSDQIWLLIMSSIGIVGMIIGIFITHFINNRGMLNKLKSDKKINFIEGYCKTLQDLFISNSDLRANLKISEDFKNPRIVELQHNFIKNQKELVTDYLLFARIYITDDDIYNKVDKLNKLVINLADIYNNYLMKKIKINKFDSDSKIVVEKITKDINLLIGLLKDKNYIFKI